MPPRSAHSPVPKPDSTSVHCSGGSSGPAPAEGATNKGTAVLAANAASTARRVGVRMAGGFVPCGAHTCPRAVVAWPVMGDEQRDPKAVVRRFLADGMTDGQWNMD